ncbi:MAG: hypothetical protein STHCBS139747_002737 [Sporothrix thermara]
MATSRLNDYEWPPLIGSISIKYPGGCALKYDGYRLTSHNVGYEPDVSFYLPLTSPLRTKRGQIAKRQPPPPPRKSLAWWRAQCSFRGLPNKGDIAKLQQNLRGHESDPLTPALQALESQARADYRVKNNAEGELRWTTQLTDERKVISKPQRFYAELARHDDDDDDDAMVRVLKGDYINDEASVRIQANKAMEQGCFAKAVEAPIMQHHLHGPSGWWLVVGPAKAKARVVEKARAIAAETAVLKEKVRREKLAAEKAQQAALRKMLATCADWDVTGTYKISCPYIASNWPDVAHDMWLKVYDTREGLAAKFNFGVATGVFMIGDVGEDSVDSEDEDDENEEEDEDGEDEGRDDKDDKDDEAVDEEDGEYKEGKTADGKLYRRYRYRWRGEETGEGEIQLGSDDQAFEITFFGPRVDRLEGTIGGGFLIDCTFTGIKTGPGAKPGKFDLLREWLARSEEAYEYAQQARWARASWY